MRIGPSGAGERCVSCWVCWDPLCQGCRVCWMAAFAGEASCPTFWGERDVRFAGCLNTLEITYPGDQ